VLSPLEVVTPEEQVDEAGPLLAKSAGPLVSSADKKSMCMSFLTLVLSVPALIGA